MKTAVYPGSFDPITVGHVDIINRVSQIFDKVVVLVAHSPTKNYLFSESERKDLIEKSLGALSNVEVDVFDGLTVNYMKKRKASVIVRGLRAVTDFEFEMSMSSMNQKIAPEVETMLVFARPEYYYVSSRAVKEVATHAGELDGLVPEPVIDVLKERLRR